MGKCSELTIRSAGIDIGTTTTQLVISQLSLKNRMPGSRIPKIEITDKEVIYRSPIHFTPILEHARVDADALRALLDEEYRKAGLDRGGIDTGAVIITGETAKKENAERIVHIMAEYAGDFVVAVAGPDVESVLAGKGSGAMDLSRQTHGRIINLDIGGGTTNIAVFNDGHLEDSTCINVGGRLVETDPVTGLATYVADPARLTARAIGIDPEVSGPAVYPLLCRHLTDAVDACAFHEPMPDGQEHMLMSNPLNPRYLERSLRRGTPLYDGVVFSGGVAEYLYQTQPPPNPYLHGDIGPLLAQAFRESRLAQQFPLVEPKEKIRATVIGAGSYSLEVSGSTIFIDWDQLPVRNVPVARVELPEPFPEPPELQHLLLTAMNRYGGAVQSGAVGIALNFAKYPGYSQLEALAQSLVHVWSRHDGRNAPLILLSEQDIGKALGQTLYLLTGGSGRFASIDSVSVRDGDYVDIGKPVLEGDVVPVVVKTLIFQSGGISI